MKSSFESLGPWERKLSVEVPPQEVGETIDRAYRAMASRAKVKGFRPGKVPRAVLERLYGDRIRNEVVQTLVERTYGEAVREHGMEPVSEPVVEPERLEAGKPLRYTARVEVKPRVTVATWRGLSLVKPDATIGEQGVDERIHRLAEMQAQLVAEEESTRLARGHFAVIDYAGTIDGSAFPGGSGTGVTIEVGSGSFLPGVEEQLEGMAKGEVREMETTFPEDERRGELAGKRARFHVTLQEIKRKVIPAIDDEFAKDVGGFDSLDALRLKTREELQAEADREAQAAVRDQARSALAASNPVDAPPALVEREFRSMVEGMRRRLASQGVSMEHLGFSPEALEKDWRPRAETSVKASLILEEIARGEGIVVGREAIDDRIRDIARDTRQTPRAVRQAYEERGLIPVLESRLKEEKALDLVLETATMQEVERAQDAAVKAKKK